MDGLNDSFLRRLRRNAERMQRRKVQPFPKRPKCDKGTGLIHYRYKAAKQAARRSRIKVSIKKCGCGNYVIL